MTLALLRPAQTATGFVLGRLRANPARRLPAALPDRRLDVARDGPGSRDELLRARLMTLARLRPAQTATGFVLGRLRANPARRLPAALPDRRLDVARDGPGS